MKTTFFFFAMLISVAAGAQVTNVTPISANYTDQTVSFRVWWNAGSRDATHLSKVWVWVDYITVNSNNTTSGNSWTRAAVSAASPAASVTYDGSNRQGFWLQGNSGSYSATVTVQLNITASKFNWCAYVSDYPPNMVMDEQACYFKGTPPFVLKEANGTVHEIPQASMPKSNLTFVPVSITDKTECPGGLKEVIGTCAYTGTDWYADPEHKCQQRTSGAQNWEAWIKDNRDDELYRIVLMPDNKWWLAQNVKLTSYNNSTVGSAISGCTKDECGRAYTWAQVYAQYAGGTSGSSGNVQGICPPGWLLPTGTTYADMVKDMGIASNICASLRPLKSSCSPINDTYGWASVTGIANGGITSMRSLWYTNDTNREDGFDVDSGDTCNSVSFENLGDLNQTAVVRCFRQL